MRKTAKKSVIRDFLVFHLTHLQECLNLQRFSLSLHNRAKMSATMDIDIDYRYLYAVISWGDKVVDLWKSGERRLIIECLCHELTHLVTSVMDDPFRENGTPETRSKLKIHYDEQCTEELSRWAFRLYSRWYTEQKFSKYSFDP